MLCFENKILPYYLTEKLLHAWLAGTIPIYAGASRLPRWLNPRSFIHVTDFSPSGIAAVLDRITHLTSDQDAYDAMFAEPLLCEPSIPHELTIPYLQSQLTSALQAVR